MCCCSGDTGSGGACDCERSDGGCRHGGCGRRDQYLCRRSILDMSYGEDGGIRYDRGGRRQVSCYRTGSGTGGE